VPVAVICLVEPTTTEGVTGVTVTELSVGSTKNPLQAHIALSTLARQVKSISRRSLAIFDVNLFSESAFMVSCSCMIVIVFENLAVPRSAYFELL
jgi:hypothetical protein